MRALLASPLNLLLVAAPISWVVHALLPESPWTFVSVAISLIPLAGLIGTGTEQLAVRSGPAVGGFLNATFGNAPELIIALFALGQGLHEVVKASIVGSILGNILLVLGAAMLAGGIGREKQTFSRTTVSVQTTMLPVNDALTSST